MSWYFNHATGQIVEYTGVLKFGMDREIDLEKAAAKAHVPQLWFGPFATKEQAQAFATANPAGLNQAGKAVYNTVNDIPSAINNAVKTLAQIYLRTAEIAVGVVLLAVALNAILKQATGVDVAASAASAGKKAAVLAAV